MHSAASFRLNTNKRLYTALKAVVEKGDVVPTTEEDDHVSKLFLFDFEQSGIHLDDSTRKEVVSLNDYALQVGSHFSNNALQPRAVKKSDLPESIRGCFASDGDHVIVPGLYTDADNELVREAAYRAYLHPDPHQSHLLDELLASRHRLAQLCGFPTFAHRTLRGSIAGSPDAVEQFLGILSAELRPRFQLKSSDYAPYLSLGCCMDGLNEIFRSLYGVCLEAEDVKAGEVWHPDVVKLVGVSQGVALSPSFWHKDFLYRC
ncbi:hypothetical protein HPB48_017005 [Haemaphysalis longicornis]|uniref:Peptidase M3A/M3B catalytic domain-containing protein n=1 Tax=Haemaphysalis longicornis TaxID=44386 RepID=A0A9J6G908_HAELO|nr:hypothetical protein HPB48_017005 [Haemaphysalis longicornis]